MFDFEVLLAVYFIYGLAFFSMGIVLLLEVSRTPLMAAPLRLMRPLGIFGILHGLHEWMEIFILVIRRAGGEISPSILWVRVGVLAFSFIALWLYGYEAFRFARPHFSSMTIFGLATLPVFAVLVSTDVTFAYIHGKITILNLGDGLVRYLLAVPGAAVATLGLHAGALKAQMDGRRPIDRYLNWAALGFALYSISQLFVPPMDTVLAGYVSARVFQNLTGIPVQAVRTAITIGIAISMFKVTVFLERERQGIVEQAQLARLQILEQQENMRRELLKHTVQTQEEERSRIARELHDEMAQTLTAFSLDLATLQQNLPRNAKAAQLFQRLQNLGKEMSQSIYRMVHDLRPAHLDDLGLVPALQYLFDEDFSSRGLRVTFETMGTPCRADPLVETVIFRIAQEALTNTLRHASTDSASVYLEYAQDQTVFKVQDHGCGFAPDETFSPPRGWGLAGMRERIESVNGTFKVETEPGKGTLIQATIPC